jgi:peptide-methionine (S)-S-oxide reductase
MALGIASMMALASCGAPSDAGSPRVAAPPAAKVATPVAGDETAVFAGGCFWGVEAVFERLKGVRDVVSGYAGGDPATATYNLVSSGRTAHAESVRVSFDPSQISYRQLLEVFFSVAHDPTELNRQGPDVGPQYRSAIFFSSDEQKAAAEAFIAQLRAQGTFSRPIVTELAPLKTFYPAEAYHQDYLVRHPNQPYIVMHDLPKLAALQQKFPHMYTAPKP